MGSEPTDTNLEQEVVALRRQLRERDEFLAVVSHELRNPISPLYMQIAVIAERVSRASGPIERDWLAEELQRLTRRCDHFIASLNRLLDVTRIGEGQFDLHPTDCDLVEIVNTCVRTFPELLRFQIDVVVAGLASVRGDWDRMRLEQIVTNLVSNAIKYGLGRPIEITIDVDDADAARLRVRDHGVGIRDEDRGIIFERFRRVGDVRRNAGFGVGLWLVAELCRAMRGSVSVASEPERGTTFTVTLPRAHVHTAHSG